jgi:predicted dehydrogenase
LTVKIIHVGVGGWGLDWEQNVVSNVPGVERVAAVDASPEILATAQKTLGIPASRCFSSLSEAVASVEADAALITVPLPFHIPVVLEALELGVHALVEKPFAPTVADARMAVERADELGLLLAVSQNYRFFPASRMVREIVASGELGKVGSISVDFRKHVTREGGGHRHFTLPDPLLVDMAIHHWDLMRYLLADEPTALSCTTWNPGWSPFIENAAGAAVVEFAGGATVSWRGSWVSPSPATTWTGEWHMEFEQGEVIWQARGDHGWTGDDSVMVRRIGGKLEKRVLPPMPLYGRRGSLNAFAEAITARSVPVPDISGRNNLNTLDIAFTAVKSAAEGRRLEFGS